MPDGRWTRLSAALAESVAVDYTQAWAMPREYYTDVDLFDLERKRLFGEEWICIGRSDEVKEPGDRMAFQLCDEPLVAVRGEDRILRVFSNVCRHRGALITEGKANGPRLVCPYHHWSYDLEGKLAGAPRLEQHKGFARADCRLPQFAAEEWKGFIFANLSKNPPPLGPRLQGLERLINPYHMEEMASRYVINESWPVNWKCFIENFMEGYHLSPLHRTTLHPLNPTKLCTHFTPGETYFGYNAGFSPDLPRSYKGHPDLNDAEATNCVMFAIPPGLVSGCSGDYSSFICVQPEAVDRTRVKMGLIFYGDTWKQVDVDYAVDLFHQYMGEDKEVLALQMKGLASPHYERGPLAPADFEGSVLDFYRYYARRMTRFLNSDAIDSHGN